MRFTPRPIKACAKSLGVSGEGVPSPGLEGVATHYYRSWNLVCFEKGDEFFEREEVVKEGGEVGVVAVVCG